MVKHLACIMDGNRRWAIKQGFASWFGHKKGFDTIQRVIDFCLDNTITYLSLYAFSLENLEQRSQTEQAYLFEVLAQEALQDLEQFKRKKVRIHFIGDYSLFPLSIKNICAKAEEETKMGDALQVNFLLCYGGQQEIVDATKRIAEKVKDNSLQLTDITVQNFKDFLWTGNIPSPDLIIRTGGQQRLSNFLLFQCAYSEFYFLDILWPDISADDLQEALVYFEKSRKNFGK
jgi:undecaprenyl diphosphate synthase